LAKPSQRSEIKSVESSRRLDPQSIPTEYEKYLMDKLFSNPAELPLRFKSWVADYVVNNSDISLAAIPNLKGEVWREVGATNQPAFTNGWSNPVAGTETIGFFKDPMGIVHMKGTGDSPAGAPNGNFTAAFTLPAGYRPLALTNMPTVGISAGVGYPGILIITSAGVVTPTLHNVAANAAVSEIHFNCSFRAA
jgi:hypothetical protein